MPALPHIRNLLAIKTLSGTLIPTRKNMFLEETKQMQ